MPRESKPGVRESARPRRRHAGDAATEAARLRAAIDIMEEGLSLYDRDDRLIMVNDRFRAMLPTVADVMRPGMTFEEVSRLFGERRVYPQADRDPDEYVRGRLEAHRKPGSVFLRELADGRWHLIREGRLPGGETCISRLDVTELKRREIDLERQSIVLQGILENMGQGLLVVDGELRIAAFNRRFFDLNALPPFRFRVGDPYAQVLRHFAERGDFGPGDPEALLRRRLDDVLRRDTYALERRMPDGRVLDIRAAPGPGGYKVRTYTDVTERERARELLRESEARFRDFAATASDFLWETDADLRFTYLSESHDQILGRPGADLIGKTIAEAIALAEQPPEWRRRFEEFEARRPVRDFRVATPSGAGDLRAISVSAIPLLDSAGRFRGYRGTARDVTREVEATRALTEERRLLETIIDNIPHLISWKDTQSRYLGCNAAFARSVGVASQDELVGKTVFDLEEFHEQAGRLRAEDVTVLESGQPLLNIEQVRTFADGRDVTLLRSKVPLRTAGSETLGVVSIFADITELKQAERELAATARANAAVAELGRFAVGGEGLQRLFERTVAVVAGTLEAPLSKVLEYLPEAHAFRFRAGFGCETPPAALIDGSDSPAGHAIRSDAPLVYEDLARETRFSVPPVLGEHGVRAGAVVAIPGSRRPFGVIGVDFREPRRFTPIELGFLDAVASLLAQAIERERVEERLHQVGRVQAVGQLTGGIAHDFNNLLQVILGNAELLDLEGGGNPRLGRFAQSIRRAAERGALLTHRLLAFSRKQPLRPVETDLNALVRAFLPTARAMAGDGIAVRADLAAEPCLLSVDPAQMDQALGNLVSNARDAMPGGGTLTFTTATAVIGDECFADALDLAPGAYATLTVADTGTGMTPDVAEKAVEPFFSTKGVGKGSGLGLSMVYGFVKQSGGHLVIESAPDAGTTVRLYLPCVAAGGGDRG